MKTRIPSLLLFTALASGSLSLKAQNPPPPINQPVPPGAPRSPEPQNPGPPRTGFGGGGGGGSGGAGFSGGGGGFGGAGFSSSGDFQNVADKIRLDLNREINGFRGPGAQTLILRGTGLDEPKARELEEDINVMSRVLDKAVSRSSGQNNMQDKVLGIVVSALPGSRTPQNLYLDGYGALFILQSHIPLVPPPTADREDKEPKRESSSAWDEARRELYGGPGAGPGGRGPGDGAVYQRYSQSYDADKVEALKRDLIDALKDASNIRHLKADDTVTITVTGGDGGPMMGPRAVTAGYVKGPAKPGGPGPENPDQPGNGGNRERALADRGRAESDRARTETNRAYEQRVQAVVARTRLNNSALTLRAKKADIDAFAKGKMDLDAFRKKVSINLY